MTLHHDERAAIAAQFGVADPQVERDYLISLILAHLSDNHGDDIVFFGGTALARAHLPDGRLSEDIDLVATAPRDTVATELTRSLPRFAQRRIGRLEWANEFSSSDDTQAARLVTADGRTGVKIQLLSGIGIPQWPTKRQPLVQRYRDVPPATLTVPTLQSFAAAKTVAWCDRAAPRDLWDLWALSNAGGINADAAQLFRRYGPTNKPPRPWQFSTAPTQAQWIAQLAGQTRLTIASTDALAVVRRAWQEVVADI